MNDDVLGKYIDLTLQGHKDLFIAEQGGLSFICKPLSYYEYKLCTGIEESLGAPDSNEAILKISVLHPSRPKLLEWINSNSIKAADPDHLAETILVNSILKDKEDILDLYKEARESVTTNFMSLVHIYICTAFKSLTPIDIDKMCMKDIITLLVKAEEMIGEPINIAGMFGIEEKPTPHGVPVSPGMETTDFLHPDFADDAITDAFRQ